MSKKLIQLLKGLESEGFQLVTKEHNMNIVFPDYKSHRIGTTITELVSIKNKKKFKKKCREMMKQAIDETYSDYKQFLAELQRHFKKELRDREKHEKQLDDDEE